MSFSSYGIALTIHHHVTSLCFVGTVFQYAGGCQIIRLFHCRDITIWLHIRHSPVSWPGIPGVFSLFITSQSFLYSHTRECSYNFTSFLLHIQMFVWYGCRPLWQVRTVLSVASFCFFLYWLFLSVWYNVFIPPLASLLMYVFGFAFPCVQCGLSQIKKPRAMSCKLRD